MQSLLSYNALVRKVDEFVERTVRKYAPYISCRIGCSFCCECSFGVFPVEAWAVGVWLREKEEREREKILEQLAPSSGKTCPALVERRCVIYPVRPILCRTQGLPVLKARERGTLELSFCKENFRAAGSTIKIEGQFILNLENLNAALATVNEWFRREWSSLGRGDLPERVKVTHFLEELTSKGEKTGKEDIDQMGRFW
jgi:Fe-S-cluster containining protein